MKTKLINFRVEETEFSKIKRVSAATQTSVTDMIRAGLTLFMKSVATKTPAENPMDQAFNGLLGSGKIVPLTPMERDLVASHEARKSAGTLKTISSARVLAEIDAELAKGAPKTSRSSTLRSSKIEKKRSASL